MSDQATKRSSNPGHFGPEVIGQKAYEEEQAMVEEGRHIFGPAVTHSHPVTETDGGPKTADGGSSPTAVVRDREGSGPSVGQFDLVGGAGGWYKAEHIATGAMLTEDGELTDDPDDAKSFGPGEENAREKLQALLQEIGQEAREREILRDQEPGPAVTDPHPEVVSEVEEAVRAAMNDEGYLSLEDQEELLEEAGDALRDRIIDAEFSRADGVRKEGLRNLIEAERQRDDGPRPRALNRLERAFAQLTAQAND